MTSPAIKTSCRGWELTSSGSTKMQRSPSCCRWPAVTVYCSMMFVSLTDFTVSFSCNEKDHSSFLTWFAWRFCLKSWCPFVCLHRWRMCGTWWKWSGHPAQLSMPAATSITWCLSAGSVKWTGAPGTAFCCLRKRRQLIWRWKMSTRSVHVNICSYVTHVNPISTYYSRAVCILISGFSIWVMTWTNDEN